MVKRLGEVGFVVVLAFGVGYLMWGLKVDRLAAQVKAMREVIVRTAGPIPGYEDSEGTSYNDFETRLQEQLEECLFEKAKLVKEAKTARSPKLLPRVGSAPFNEYATSPLAPDSE